MRLSWNEIRIRAAAFAKEWRNAFYEKGEPHSFYNDFFDIFGVRRRTVARYEEHVKRLDNSSGFIDLFWPGGFASERERVEHLFGLYEKMIAPLETRMEGKSRRRSGRRPARGEARR